MGRSYEYKEVNINDLLLDDENPRFASSALVNDSQQKVSQKSIIEHLVKYADIDKLADRINEVRELHGSELVTCYQRDESYIVIEGNRRICACKLLLDRNLIPENKKASFPFIDEGVRENIEILMINLYPNRESVQAFLSDRHITGVKKWSSLEKNNYYMNLFDKFHDIKEVKNYTSDSTATIKKCIQKYQFFMDVFHILQKRYPKIEIEKIDYLPLVDRFMNTLLGNDKEVGLNLSFDETSLKYSCDKRKQELYDQILMLVGEAFLIRKENKYCEGVELSKIISSELFSLEDQKTLIINNERIPGLIDLIRQFKYNDEEKVDVTFKDSDAKQGQDNEGIDDDEKRQDDEGRDDDEKGQDDEGGDENDEGGDEKDGTFRPNVKYKPHVAKKEHLIFTLHEARSFKINGDSDYEVKLRSVIYDLSCFSVYKHPYTCALLYRTLLEISTKLVFERYGEKLNITYNEDNLNTNLNILNNNFLFNNSSIRKVSNGKEAYKVKESINNYCKTTKIINTLNLYIHYPNPVDENILISSWNTMKLYLIACLTL